MPINIPYGGPNSTIAQNAANPSYSTLTEAGSPDQQNAMSIVEGTLQQYGLQSLANWAWNEITNGAQSAQVLTDIYQTPQFKARFPGIEQRTAAGLPPISPADYVSYEDQAKQLENQYGLPSGFLDNSQVVGNLIGQDVSMTELTDRVQNGYAAVAYSPAEVRQAYAQMFGAQGDGALAAQFLDTNRATQLLTEQATAAQISGQASMGGIQMTGQTAMKLAQTGQTATGVGSTLQDLIKQSPLYNATINENQKLTSDTGVQAAFGLSQAAEQETEQREQARQAEFQGGGGAYTDTYGAEGIGAAKPI